MTDMSDEDIAAAYYKNFITQSDEGFWAFETVAEMCGDLRQGIDITLRLIDASDDDLYLAYLAAGPVEDLIKRHGAQAVRLFEVAADNSDKVRRALAGIYLSPNADAYAEWQRLLTKYETAAKTCGGTSNP